MSRVRSVGRSVPATWDLGSAGHTRRSRNFDGREVKAKMIRRRGELCLVEKSKLILGFFYLFFIACQDAKYRFAPVNLLHLQSLYTAKSRRSSTVTRLRTVLFSAASCAHFTCLPYSRKEAGRLIRCDGL